MPTKKEPAAGTPRKAAPAKKAAAAPTKAARAPKPAAKEKPPAVVAPKAKPERRLAGAPPIEKTRVVVPMAFYEPHKDAIKAPFKAHGMKWNFLGEGKGLYKREKEIHCFTQFLDDGVHYSIWGEDKQDVADILGVWRNLLGDTAWTIATTQGEAAAQAEVAKQESDETRLWKMAEPQPRAGEPDFFLQKRKAEWLAKKPGG